MKIAILADIHGNIHSLEAVLEDLEQQHVDQVVVNGDLVNRGPNSLAVLERLWGNNFIFTLGNHDDLVRMWVEHDPKIPAAWYSDPFWAGTADLAKELAAAGWIDLLRSFNMRHEICLPGAPRVLIAHGSPRHYREGLALYTPEKILYELATEFDADIFIGSHTHRPLDRTFRTHRFINTGAVGTPFNRNPHAQYLLMRYHKQDWHAEFRSVPYDRDAAIAAFADTGYLEKGLLSAHIFREELIHASPLFDPFWRWTGHNQKPRDWASWTEFREMNQDRFARICDRGVTVRSEM